MATAFRSLITRLGSTRSLGSISSFGSGSYEGFEHELFDDDSGDMASLNDKKESELKDDEVLSHHVILEGMLNDDRDDISIVLLEEDEKKHCNSTIATRDVISTSTDDGSCSVFHSSFLSVTTVSLEGGDNHEEIWAGETSSSSTSKIFVQLVIPGSTLAETKHIRDDAKEGHQSSLRNKKKPKKNKNKHQSKKQLKEKKKEKEDNACKPKKRNPYNRSSSENKLLNTTKQWRTPDQDDHNEHDKRQECRAARPVVRKSKSMDCLLLEAL